MSGGLDSSYTLYKVKKAGLRPLAVHMDNGWNSELATKNIRVNNEFYVCPVYNEFLAKNKKVKIHNVDKMWGLGTPEDLDNFIRSIK